MTTPRSFDNVRLLAKSLDRSPLALSDSDMCDLLHEVRQNSKLLSSTLPHLRAFAGRWVLDNGYEHYDSEFVHAPYRSAVTVLAEQGFMGFLSMFDVREEDEPLLQEYFTDVVRLEWQFAQLLMDKPEHLESYKEQLRQAYSSLVDRMKKDFPNLPWESRSRVGQALAA